jgi:flagellar biosynthesis/type III secretory pathway protein FliH
MTETPVVADDGDPMLDFAAERAAILSTAHLQMVMDAGENELREAAAKITLDMFQKAFSLGYAKGFKDQEEHARQQAAGIQTVEFVHDGVTGE